MPEIQYPTNPNSDTAFVVQEGGTKNRALMTAPQDTSTLELPSNPNSTKGYVTVDGKKHRVVLTANIAGGGGGGGAVDSVNGKTGTVVLTAKDVAALPQYSEMPEASSENQGDIVQYVGATTANYTNGYVYKCVQETVHPASIAFSDPDISFDSDYALVFDEFVAAAGVPNYWEVLDKVYVICNDDQEDLWTIGVNDDETTYIYKEGLTRQEVAALGFVLPPEQQVVSYEGALSWSSENINKWVHIDLGSYVPSYSVLPTPSENNAGQVILYTGEPVSQEQIGKNPIVAGKLYICKAEYAWNIEIAEDGQFTVNILDTNEFIEAVGEESGSMTFTAVVSGGDVSWEVDGETADPADYGITVYPYGTIEDGDNFVVDWEREQVPYAWWPVSSTETPSEVPILASDGWGDNNIQTVYAPNVTENNTVIVSPAPKSVDDYAAAGIVCVDQKYGELTFTCKTVPENDIELSIAII